MYSYIGTGGDPRWAESFAQKEDSSPQMIKNNEIRQYLMGITLNGKDWENNGLLSQIIKFLDLCDIYVLQRKVPLLEMATGLL